MKKLFPAASWIAGNSLFNHTAARTFGGAIVFLVAGCAVLDTHQAKLDQRQLRDTLMDYTEDQILDNLIRAYNGRAIVHFDVKTVTATVASKVAPNVGYGRTVTSNQFPGNATQTTTMKGPTNNLLGTTVQTTIGAASAIVGTVTEPFTSSLAAERTNNVLVDVKPQDERKIYAAYIKFLNTGSESPNTEESDAKETSKPTKNAKDKQKQELETSKVTTTVTSIKVPAPANEETSPTPTITPEPSPTGAVVANAKKEVQETTATKTEAVPKKQKDTGADLVVKAHPSPPLATRDMQPLMQTRAKPLPEQVLVGPKRWNNDYYWVPVEYRRAFFELCVATVTKGASTISAGEAAKTKAQQDSEDVKNELEDFNSLQRLRLGTPP
jgi:hypothetical protein